MNSSMRRWAWSFAGGVAGWSWPAKRTHAHGHPTSVGGIETVCTGVGAEAQQDPRWQAYPVRVDVSMAGPVLSGAHVVLAGSGGRPIANVDCAGSWVLFKVEPGRTGNTGDFECLGQAPSASFSSPAAVRSRGPRFFGSATSSQPRFQKYNATPQAALISAG